MNALDWIRGSANTPDIVLLGAPISRASISPSEAWSTPPAFREALQRFPLWDAAHGVDLSTLRIRDAGDVAGDRGDSDAGPAHRRIQDATSRWTASAPVVVIIGGDNSLTRPAMLGLMEARPAAWGLITLDAHHDVREQDGGPRNGTPVRDLIEAGLPGKRVAQIGIHPFGNRREHAEWAFEHGISAYSAADVREQGMGSVLNDAVSHVAAQGATMLYADFDIDVVDRAFAPACPASMPGGILPSDLCDAAFALGADKRVVAADLCEVDANRDVNSTTVRLMAQVFMSFCAGVASRADGAAT